MRYDHVRTISNEEVNEERDRRKRMGCMCVLGPEVAIYLEGRQEDIDNL